MNSSPLSKKYITYGIPPPSNKIKEDRNWRPMVWNNLIVGSHDLHNVAKVYVAKAYAKILNVITNFVETTPPTNTIIYENILTQYSIKHRIRIFDKKARIQYKNNCSSFMTTELLIQRIPDISAFNNK